MGSYKWAYKSPKMVMTIVILLITPLITPHEPPSKPQENSSEAAVLPGLSEVPGPA